MKVQSSRRMHAPIASDSLNEIPFPKLPAANIL